MKIIKQDKYRKIVLSYKEIRNLWNVKFEGNFTMSTCTCSENDFRIYRFKESITYWEIEYTRKEIESKLKLLPKEIVVDFNYSVYYGYYAKIETTEKNIKYLNELDDRRLKSMGFFERYFWCDKYIVEDILFRNYTKLLKNRDTEK